MFGILALCLCRIQEYMFPLIGSKTIPEDSRDDRGRRQSGICFDW